MTRKTDVRRTVGASEQEGIAKRFCPEHALHVDWNEKLDRWEVVDEEGRAIGHCPDASEAIAFAVREAQRAHCKGDDVLVCVQQPDGAHAVVWSSI